MNADVGTVVLADFETLKVGLGWNQLGGPLSQSGGERSRRGTQ
jgi:hypothetical protein